jgi:hypothetical protein
MINFPTTFGQPIDGTFTHAEAGQLWAWNGATWNAIAGTAAAGPDYVQKTGDTMTGGLTVPSLNGGQLAGFRNVLINGNLAINQRGVTIAAAAVGSYGPDRWKKVDASNMTQVVEAGNFVPGLVYTLSGTGVTTQQVTAPVTGNWTLPNIPITASRIQLELGTVATPFEHRSLALELLLCQRYYEKGEWTCTGQTYAANGDSRSSFLSFAVHKRVAPTVTLSTGTMILFILSPVGVTVNVSGSAAALNTSINGFSLSTMGNSVNLGNAVGGSDFSWAFRGSTTYYAAAEL